MVWNRWFSSQFVLPWKASLTPYSCKKMMLRMQWVKLIHYFCLCCCAWSYCYIRLRTEVRFQYSKPFLAANHFLWLHFGFDWEGVGGQFLGWTVTSLVSLTSTNPTSGVYHKVWVLSVWMHSPKPVSTICYRLVIRNVECL